MDMGWRELDWLFWVFMGVGFACILLWALRLLRMLGAYGFHTVARKWEDTEAYKKRTTHLRDIHHTVDYRHLCYHVRVFDAARYSEKVMCFTFYATAEPLEGDLISYQNGPPQDTRVWRVKSLGSRVFSVRPDKCYQVQVDLYAEKVPDADSA